ncbi:hypothetical protein SAMN00777080_0242 [Aquiflexum balticum DSM 16537]|uniref:Uncharacterized protein n=1 Tax=Aquiflexum balticum DSM 16537 TaxID=758820 RepID=A0A1W2GZ79_9BACT|nr:hypothetical protein SAMN00777080_0242 [Aquiflexum balticum DSM 16537]
MYQVPRLPVGSRLQSWTTNLAVFRLPTRVLKKIKMSSCLREINIKDKSDRWTKSYVSRLTSNI